MTQTPTTSTTAAAAPAEAGLSDAIAAALPPDPYEQLEVARKITAVAVASRASRLEHEAARLRQKLADKDRLAADLADRAAALDQALREADARLRAILDDNVRAAAYYVSLTLRFLLVVAVFLRFLVLNLLVDLVLGCAKAKLVKERDSLAHTSKKLARDLAKVTALLHLPGTGITRLLSSRLLLILFVLYLQLETFKRHLMQSLGDENSSVSSSSPISQFLRSKQWPLFLCSVLSSKLSVLLCTESGNCRHKDLRAREFLEIRYYYDTTPWTL